MSDRQAKLERARARREEMERQTAAESQRARRMRMLGGAAALAIVVVVIAVIVGSSGGSSSKSKAAPNAGAVRAQSAQISAMFAEIWYRNQQDENTAYATDSYIRSIAAGVPGLNISQAMSARQSATVSKQLSDASQLFNAAGFSGTP